MKKFIYFDNNATTEIDPSVLSEMLIDLKGPPYNPSSIHIYGQRAKKYLTEARRSIASYFSVNMNKLIFTSGGTEALNTAIFGLLPKNKQGHIISTNIEHPCIYQPLQQLKNKGYDVSFLSPNSKGSIDIKDFENAINKDTVLAVFSAVNTETGKKFDINGLCEIANDHNIPIIIDAIGLLGKTVNINILEKASAVCFSSHKIHGPKGCGLLILKSNNFTPMLLGGVQELNKRAGSENLAAILGFAKSIKILEENGSKFQKHMKKLQTLFEDEITSNIKDVYVNAADERICNTSNLLFKDIDGESFLINLDRMGILASLGSACTAGSLEPSRVLLNMGLSPKDAISSIRFSFSRFNTAEEIKLATSIIKKIVFKMRSII